MFWPPPCTGFPAQPQQITQVYCISNRLNSANGILSATINNPNSAPEFYTDSPVLSYKCIFCSGLVRDLFETASIHVA